MFCKDNRGGFSFNQDSESNKIDTFLLREGRVIALVVSRRDIVTGDFVQGHPPSTTLHGRGDVQPLPPYQRSNSGMADESALSSQKVSCCCSSVRCLIDSFDHFPLREASNLRSINTRLAPRDVTGETRDVRRSGQWLPETCRSNGPANRPRSIDEQTPSIRFEGLLETRNFTRELSRGMIQKNLFA